jgi:STE24 endopeptidase
MTDRPVLDPARQAEARRYSRARRRIAIADTIGSIVYLSLWVVSGAAQSASAFLEGRLAAGWLVELLTMAVLMAAPWLLISLPAAYYAGYLLPHRFGQSNQSRRLWFADEAKGFAIASLIGSLVLLAVYAAMKAWPAAWWMVAAVGAFFALILLTMFAPVVLMPIFFKFRPLADGREALSQRLTRLAGRAGAMVQGVFTFDMSRRTKDANASLVGIGRTRRILLGDTLIEEFTEDEIETVLAHELGHHVHRDLPLGLVLQGAILAVILWVANAGLQASVARGYLSAVSDVAGLPILVLTLALCSAALAPAQNAFSRRRERRADQFAVALTQNPEAFVDAMTRLANQNLADANPPRWAVILFGTHPPLRERIQTAQAAGVSA